jgi:hypothetical protein
MPAGCQFYIYYSTQETKVELNLIGDCLSGAFFLLFAVATASRAGLGEVFPYVQPAKKPVGWCTNANGKHDNKNQTKQKEKNCCIYTAAGILDIETAGRL